MRGRLVKAWCRVVVGVAELLILYEEAFALMPFGGHWIEVCNEALDRLIVAVAIGRVSI